MAAIQKNILEHISIMAQEQVQIEFREQMMQMQSLQQASTNESRSSTNATTDDANIEARKAVLIAEMTEDFMKEENKITSQFDSDPLLKLKSREVDLEPWKMNVKKKMIKHNKSLQEQDCYNLKDNFEDKLEQNEDLAKLRAGVSLAKSGVQQMSVIDEN